MLAHVYSASLKGIDATPVVVEVDVESRGLRNWSMVGLLETAVKEARDRVGSAIKNAGFSLPQRNTVINLSPADIKKSGAHHDLAIAVGLLIAAGICKPKKPARFMFAGELSLTGAVLPVNGALLMAGTALKENLDGIIVPAANVWETKFATGGNLEVIGIETLNQVVEFFNEGVIPESGVSHKILHKKLETLDFSEVRGQPLAKRGLEIAAAGGHNIALKGPPGTGKTMLAERLPTILPPLSHEETVEVARIMSWHGFLKNTADIPTERPFRAPHHSASYAGLIGGATAGQPKLGEISLAHNGVLFLDEMGEFRKDVIEVLRQPMESGEVRLVRAGFSFSYPARFMLVGAFNPCRCGYLGHPRRNCVCSINQIRSYRTKLSGPILDRIDLHINVGPPLPDDLLDGTQEELSEKIRERVIWTRKKQHSRFGDGKSCNAHLTVKGIAKFCKLGSAERGFLTAAAKNSNLSARAVHRVIKVARTIADMANTEEIKQEHLAEAIQFRPQLDEIF